MKQRRFGLLAYAAAFSAIVFLLVTCIDLNCFNRRFYEQEYVSLDTAAELSMSHQDLMKATNALLDYLQDRQDHIVAEIQVNGFDREAFNERETLHMIDVKGLYQFALSLRLAAGVIFIVSIAVLWWKQRANFFDYLSLAYAQCAFVFLLFVVFLGMWAAVDFSSLWESFHHLFFTNDLWLLNPHTDLMINLFPESFFFDMVVRIAVSFIAVFGGLWVAAAVYLYRFRLFQYFRKERTS